MAVKTILLSEKSEIPVEHAGTSGITITATRGKGMMDIVFAFHVETEKELVTMVGTLLAQLEEMKDETFINKCLVKYIETTGKTIEHTCHNKPYVVIYGSDKGKRKRWRR